MYMEKEASLALFKSIGRALKETLFGTEKMHTPAGIMLEEREKAKILYDAIKAKLHPFRARIKTPESIENNLKKGDTGIKDLLGMQIYSKSPNIATNEILNILEDLGAMHIKVKKLKRPGYIGANISTEIEKVPMEVQLSPGLRSNFGQILQHDAYKRPANFTDWDAKYADKIGAKFINWGYKNKQKWKDYLNDI